MDEDMIAFTVSAAEKALAPRGASEAGWAAQGDAAVAAVKAALDGAYGPTFHVIAGKGFGSRVHHDRGTFAFFQVGERSVLVFKSG